MAGSETSLVLKDERIDAARAAEIAENLRFKTTLTTLKLFDCTIDDAGAAAIAEALKSNTTLRALDLEQNTIGNPGAAAIFDAVKSNTTLTTLDLKCCKIDDAGAAAILDALMTNPILTSVNMSNNRPVNPEIVKAINEKCRQNLKAQNRRWGIESVTPPVSPVSAAVSAGGSSIPPASEPTIKSAFRGVVVSLQVMASRRGDGAMRLRSEGEVSGAACGGGGGGSSHPTPESATAFAATAGRTPAPKRDRDEDLCDQSKRHRGAGPGC